MSLVDDLLVKRDEWKTIYIGEENDPSYIPHSYVYRYEKYCIKQVVKYKDEFWNEVNYLKMLQKYDFIPRLYDFSEFHRIIVMEYIDGANLYEIDDEKYFKEKEKIDAILKKHMSFIDDKREHYIVKCGKLYRIDFGSS